MKTFISITLVTVLLFSCGNESKKTAEESTSPTDASVVYVYYFHGKQRCRTCIAIENVTKSVIAENYKDNSSVKYVEVKIDDDSSKDLTEKYEIAFSSLIIAKGEDRIDLTKQAFANAVDMPGTLADHIKTEVNKRID